MKTWAFRGGISAKTIWNFSCICTTLSKMSRSPRPRVPSLLYLPAHPFSLSRSLSFSLSFLPHLSRPVHRDDWRIDSSRVVQSGLRHRVCVFQKCWRRLSRRSSSSPHPPSSSSFTPDPPPLFSASPLLFPPPPPTRLLLVSKSMGRVLAVERARIRGDQSPRAWGIDGSPDFGFSTHHAAHTRYITDLTPLIYLTVSRSLKFGRARRRRTSRRHVESLSIVNPCW